MAVVPVAETKKTSSRKLQAISKPVSPKNSTFLILRRSSMSPPPHKSCCCKSLNDSTFYSTWLRAASRISRRRLSVRSVCLNNSMTWRIVSSMVKYHQIGWVVVERPNRLRTWLDGSTTSSADTSSIKSGMRLKSLKLFGCRDCTFPSPTWLRWCRRRVERRTGL